MRTYFDRHGDALSYRAFAYTRARVTNSLEAPRALDRKGKRRWNDLLRHFASRIGPQTVTDEGTRAKVGVLINLVMKLEAARDGSARPLGLASEIQAVQQLTALLNDLGLDGDPAQPMELEVKSGSGFRLASSKKPIKPTKPSGAQRPTKPSRPKPVKRVSAEEQLELLQ